jgi:hypothetical protein
MCIDGSLSTSTQASSDAGALWSVSLALPNMTLGDGTPRDAQDGSDADFLEESGKVNSLYNGRIAVVTHTWCREEAQRLEKAKAVSAAAATAARAEAAPGSNTTLIELGSVGV